MSLKYPLSSLEKEGKFQASKWMHVRLFLSKKELEALFHHLGSFDLVSLSKLSSIEDLIIAPDLFFSLYQEYLLALKRGQKTDKKVFSLAMVEDPESLFFAQLKPSLFAARLKKPCIQISLVEFSYDEELGECFFNQHAKDGISCGLQFSFPQFYEDPETRKQNVHFKDLSFSHTALFKALQQWMRNHTKPLSLYKGKNVIKTGIRVGLDGAELLKEHAEFKKQAFSF